MAPGSRSAARRPREGRRREPYWPRSRLGLHPVRQFQPVDPAKVINVVCHQGHGVGACRNTDQQIEVRDQHAGSSQFGLDITKRAGHIAVQTQHGYTADEIIDGRVILIRPS